MGPAPRLRRLLLASSAAWLVMLAVIVGRFAVSAVPLSYLARPLGVAVLVAILLGSISLVAGRHAVAIAAGLALVLSTATPETAGFVIAVGVSVALVARMRGQAPDTTLPVLFVVVTFTLIGVLRALPTVTDVRAPSTQGMSGPPTYLVLVDGYPRADTLKELGIDISAFVAALEARGFDHYPNATSSHGWTHGTLHAMLAEAQVADDPGSTEDRRAVRRKLVVPPGFLAIDPPVGHVVLNGGPHARAGGVTDFEASLLGTSAVGKLAPSWTFGWILGTLRAHLDDSLRELVTTEARHVFAHLVSPHPPFLFSATNDLDYPQCWPTCDAFETRFENLDIPLSTWSRLMSEQIHALNIRLVRAIDSIVLAHPDAVIVIFSDHGGRISADDTEEWHRPFLAARTPDYPRLFAREPGPDAILRILSETYSSGQLQQSRVIGTGLNRGR